MAASLIFLAAIIASEFTGKIQAVWILLGVIGLISTALGRSSKLPFLLGLCGLGATAWIARDSKLICVTVALLYLHRCFTSTSGPQADRLTLQASVFWLTACVFGIVWELPLILFVSCSGVAVTAPTFRIGVGVKTGQLCYGMSILFVLWPALAGLTAAKSGRIAYIEHGKWANADVSWNIDKVNMRSAYSYSEFAGLISAERISLPQLDSTFCEAWMVTPTTPITSQDLAKLESWINDGGRLILVTDHTDVFGHARVANQLLDHFGISADYTAFFPAYDNEVADDGWLGSFSLRTTNTFRGRGLFPFLTARWFNESCDYSGKNFFGRLRATGEDEHARRAIAAVRACGRGRLILMGDSTMFSNFATYAPDSLKLAALLRSDFFAAVIYQVFPWVLAFLWIGLASPSRAFGAPSVTLVALSLLMLLIGTPASPGTLYWGNDRQFVWCSGDRELVQGAHEPSTSLSTAYTVAPLSGIKPRWTDSIGSIKSGIWFSKKPPVEQGWRWISPDGGGLGVELDEQAFSPLYAALGAQPLKLWPEGPFAEKLNAGEIWTNNILGDEWFDQGLSPARLERISALCSWIRGEAIPGRAVLISVPDRTPLEWSLKLPLREEILLRLPISLGKDGEIIYLGRGVSGQWTTISGKRVLLGLKSFSENWKSPDIWTLQQMSDKK